MEKSFSQTKADTADTDAAFLDLNLSKFNGIIYTKFHEKDLLIFHLGMTSYLVQHHKASSYGEYY